MKRIKFIFSVMALALLASCSDNDYVIESNPNEFAILPVAVPVSAEGGTYEVKITGNRDWQIEMSDYNTKAIDWCTLSQTSGQGAATITINVTPSTSFVNNRTVILNVVSGNRTLKSKIIQDTQVLGENEVLINGHVWSTVNVGSPGTFVSSPDEVGMLYQFNRKTGWPWEPASAPTGWPADYTNDGTNWTEENDPSPEGWRVPTTQEMVDLWNIGATWVSAAQTGFSRDGIIVGIPTAVAATATKDNLKQLGGIFLPQCGWRTDQGLMDRTWLVAVRSATSLSATHGGMSLGDSGGYRDIWGWGDGQKQRAAMVRPIKKLEVEN